VYVGAPALVLEQHGSLRQAQGVSQLSR
jgi:hypothetical protein